MKKAQNSAARLVLKARKQDHVLPLLKTLHWLPIQTQIKYKMSRFVIPFSLKLPMSTFLTFFVYTLHQDNSAPSLTQELYKFCTLESKQESTNSAR